jgi:hypothetical protein
MAVVPENQRIHELRRLGLSEPLIRLSSGDLIHDLFRFGMLGPPYYAYHDAKTPDGPPLIPLWDHGDSVLGIWRQAGGIEFIRFCIEKDREYERLARTEQGFLAGQFDFLYESEAPLDRLREAALLAGFRFLEPYLAARQVAEPDLGTFEKHKAWLQALVAGIDQGQVI